MELAELQLFNISIETFYFRTILMLKFYMYTIDADWLNNKKNMMFRYLVYFIRLY